MPSSMAAIESAVVSVHLSGPVLACMLYDMQNSDGDQEGLLIGDVVTRRTEGISDTHMNFQKEQNFVCIRHYVPCNRVLTFYNARGQVDEDFVKSALGKHYQDLIGWYTFRRNTQLDVMFREQAVCDNLSKLMSALRRPFSVFGIFTSSSNERHTTLTGDYVFLSHADRMFEPAPVVVVNLGDTSLLEYKTSPPIFLHNHIQYYADLLKTDGHGDRPDHSSVNHVRSLQRELQTKLEDVCRQLHDTEHEHDDLQREVLLLREQVQQASQNTTVVEGGRDRTLDNRTDREKEEIPLIRWEDTKEVAVISTAAANVSKEKASGRVSRSCRTASSSADSGLDSVRILSVLPVPTVSSRTRSSGQLSSSLLTLTPRLSDPNAMEVDLTDTPVTRHHNLSGNRNR